VDPFTPLSQCDSPSPILTFPTKSRVLLLMSLVPYPSPYFVTTIVPAPGVQCSPPVTPASESRVPSSTSPQFRVQCPPPGYIYRAQCLSPGSPSRLPALSCLYPYFPIIATCRHLPYSTFIATSTLPYHTTSHLAPFTSRYPL